MAIGHIRGILDGDAQWSSSSKKLVALVMAFSADRKGIVRLTQDEIADASVLSRRRVADLIGELCDDGVFVRLGHGRYGIRYGTEFQQTVSVVNGAEQEEERLRSIMQDGQVIAYTDKGWPVLMDEAAMQSE